MTDLEKLLRDKQDALRGRPEDWIDRFVSWYNNADWEYIFAMSLMLAWPIVAVIIWACPS